VFLAAIAYFHRMNHLQAPGPQGCDDNLDPDALVIVAKEDRPRELGIFARRSRSYA
jgi:hypothetical protein